MACPNCIRTYFINEPGGSVVQPGSFTFIKRLDDLTLPWIDLSSNIESAYNPGIVLYDVKTVYNRPQQVLVVGQTQLPSIPGRFRGISYSSDEGLTWQTPGFSVPTANALDPSINSYLNNSEPVFYELSVTKNSTIWVACSAGIVLKSDYYSANWPEFTRTANFPIGATGAYPQDNLSIHFENDSKGVVGQTNAAYFTTDSGITWVPFTANLSIGGVIQPGLFAFTLYPEILGIYSENVGTPNGFILAVTQKAVLRSTNNGTTFEVVWMFGGNDVLPPASDTRGGRHLTWCVGPNETRWWATGDNNEVVTASSTSNASIWSPFNPPANNYSSASTDQYKAAHFFSLNNGFLGYSNSSGRIVEAYNVLTANSANAPGQLTSDSGAKSEIINAIWTELPVTTCYNLVKCVDNPLLGLTITVTIDPTDPDTDVSIYNNQVISGFEVDGVSYDGCWFVDGPVECVQSVKYADISAVDSFLNCTACSLPPANCLKLQNCQDPNDYIVVTPTPTTLVSAIYQSVSIPAYCTDKCWFVIPDWSCEEAITLPDDLEVTVYNNCNECLGIIREYDLRPRSIKPGFYTPGCPPDYTVKTSCMYAEQVYDEMVSIRYGINICCDHDIDRWDIKKQLLELSAIYNPDLCTANVVPCKEVCNLTASISLSGSIEPYPGPTQDPCKPPRFPDVEVDPQLICYRFSLGADASPTYTYLRKLLIGGTLANMAGYVTDPVQSPMFSMQLVNALNIYGTQCAGAYYDIATGYLTVYLTNADIISGVFETMSSPTPVSNTRVASVVSCTPIPAYNCYGAQFVLGDVITSPNLSTITVYNGTSEIIYNVAGLNINISAAGALPSLVTFLQGKGYTLTNAYVVAVLSSRYLYLSNFSGGIPVAIDPVIPGSPAPSIPGYYFQSYSTCP